MNAAAEYAAHQREYDAALCRIAEGNMWLAQWEADVAAAAAQIRAECAVRMDARATEGEPCAVS